jgi:DNA-binding PadR family transcriptional regulator
MPREELSLFSYEVLGLIGREGAGPHDLRRMVERGKLLAWAGESRYYTEPKRLAKLGYLAATKEPGRTRDRTVYKLTDKGRRALRSWAKTPAALTPLKAEALVRLLIADLVGDATTRKSLAALRDEADDLRRRLDEMVEGAEERLPHRARYLELVNEFLRGYPDLHEQLVDQVEREL